jgi:pimeloyl-ACP methyl ester carboxylesterase
VAASRRAPAGGPALADVPRARVALGILNGTHGDVLSEQVAGLALPMALRFDGRDLPAEPAALRAAYPGASDRVVVFVHGLVETEDAWCFHAERHHGDRSTTYGSLLERDLGCTPVQVRYNTGLRISANGALLDALLDQLVDAWPVPVRDLVLIGHSMGGLVARSALAQAGDGTAAGQRRWPGLVRDTITLGSPHLGAPLEQGAHRLAAALRRLPETRWLAEQVDARSVGIRDLRHGDLLESDWRAPDADALGARRTRVPLYDGARHFVVLATVRGTHDSRLGRFLGDLLVRPDSAIGDTGDDDRLAYPEDAVRRLTGLHHFDLLNHPDVYTAIRTWLTDRPEERRHEHR